MMSAIRDEILIRFDDIFVPVTVRIWQVPKPRFVAICFHEYFGSAQEFEVFALRCVKENISVVAPEAPGRRPSGFFRSSRAYHTAFFMRYFVQICERYQAPKTILVGHGFGGLLCLAAMRARLVKPFALILQNTDISSPDIGGRLVTLAKTLSLLTDSKLSALSDTVLERVREAGFGSFSSRWAKSLIEERDGYFYTRLDPKLGDADFPEIDFKQYFEFLNVKTAIFSREVERDSENSSDFRSKFSGHIKYFPFSSRFAPGFAVTSGAIIRYLDIIDRS